MFNKHHSKKSRKQISETRKRKFASGELKSYLNKIWITNDIKSKLIKKEELGYYSNQGWHRGRIQRLKK